MSQVLALVLAVAGAVFLSGGCVLQWLGHEANQHQRRKGWKVSLEPLWIGGIAASALGTFLHYAALWNGLLALVLPVSSLHIVFTALAMGWLRKEAILGHRAAGIALVAVGVVICTLVESRVDGVDRFDPRGLPAFAALAVAVLASGWFLMRPPQALSIGAGVSYAVSALAMKIGSIGSTLPAWTWMTVFVATYVAGFVCFQAGFRRGGAGMVNAVATGVSTAVALAGAVWMLGEPVKPLTWVGAALIATGVFLSGWRRSSRAQPEV
ncbi:MAG: hypothetical protein IPN71_23120 [Fibrobacteres bacterium]|nr:hypothetical protein [Fibrobacterota bacterium]